MGRYRPFPECTAQALDYCLRLHGLRLSVGEREALLEAYRRLPAFPEVPAALERLREAGFRLFAFSNGIAADVRALLAGAGVAGLLEDVVSVDEVRRFKPDPAVYAHFLRRAGCRTGEAWLVSSNPFDVMGARSAGMGAAWVRRAPEQPFDPWGEFEPSLVVPDLAALAEAFGGA